MADTFSTWLRARLIQTGAYNNTWGAVLNADALNMLDDAIAGRSEITLTGPTYSLPAMSNGSDSDSRSLTLRFGGTPGSAVVVTVPGSVTNKLYIIDNLCGQSITMTYSASVTTATIASGEKRFVWCDGSNCFSPSASAADASTLGGVAAANYARRDASNVFVTGRNSSPWITVVEGPTTTIVASAGNHQRLTLTGNRTMAAPTSPVDGQLLVLQVVQDASGGRTLTWDSVFQFQGGLPPDLTPSANGADVFFMIYDAPSARWLVGQFGSITSSSGANLNLTITENGIDVDLGALLGTLGAPVVVNLTIAQGVVLQAGSTGSYALDMDGALPVGSTLNMTVLGYILGRGGNAGDGSRHWDQGAGLGNGDMTAGYDGRAGGGAMRGPGSGVTVNITNANGHIWGGGGGGGGGGGNLGGAGIANGGGGGGGAGGGDCGRGGRGGPSNYANDGTEGSTGIHGAAGTAGTGNGSGATGEAGGSGGDWGAAGNAGTNGSSLNGGNGGAAGKAIELNGGSVNFVNGSGTPNVKGLVS